MILEPLAVPAGHQRTHDVDGVHFPHVVPSGKLLHVAVKVLRGEFVEGALVRSLEHRPKRFDAVGVNISLDVLGQAMLDGLMVERERIVHGRIVRIDLCALLHILLDERVKNLLVSDVDHFALDLVRLPVLNAGNSRLSSSNPACIGQIFPLPVGHVPADTAKVGFIYLYRTTEHAPFSASATLNRWARNHAERWLMLRSWCNFMLDTFFRLLVMRQVAIIHT